MQKAGKSPKMADPCVEGAAELIEFLNVRGYVQIVLDILRWIVVAGSVV
jgi:hypothetical protein